MWTPAQIAAMVAARGFKWLIADARFTPDPAALISACHALEVLCGVWEAEVDYGSPARAARGYDFYIGQVEGPGQYDRLVQSIPALRQEHPTLPCAVVTNMGGLATPELAAPLVTAGFSCITETWVKTDGVPPENRVAYAQRLGFVDPQPMAGLGENGATMADYPSIKTWAGYTVFTAEVFFAQSIWARFKARRTLRRLRAVPRLVTI